MVTRPLMTAHQPTPTPGRSRKPQPEPTTCATPECPLDRTADSRFCVGHRDQLANFRQREAVSFKRYRHRSPRGNQ